jgi:hypothetical protein
MKGTGRKTEGGCVLVVPDVHLKMEKLDRILNLWGDRGEVVFLGDFFDDFDDTPGINAKMAEVLRDRILPNPLHTVLAGNHDLNYHPLCQDALRCSGFEREKLRAVREVLNEEDWGRFRWATAIDGHLISHAGLHPQLAPALTSCRGGDDVGGISEWINDRCEAALKVGDDTEPLLRAGYSRYGLQPVGGIIWMDVREYLCLEGIPQIFGHTPLKTPAKLYPDERPSYCLDTHLEHVGIVRGGRVSILEAGESLAESFEREAGLRVGASVERGGIGKPGADLVRSAGGGGPAVR